MGSITIPSPSGDGRIACLLSGGLDSSTLFWQLLSVGWKVLPISVDYKQRHKRELESAESVYYAAITRFSSQNVLPRISLDLRNLGHRLGGSSQTDSTVPVPHGHYADENMKLTVVPNRNMILLASAAGAALGQGRIKHLAYGAHAGDHAIYPDCRPEFVEAMRGVLRICDYDPVELHVPYLYVSKGDIVRVGLAAGVPYDRTWTCYEGNPAACGRCGSCVERLEAFGQNGISDPITYVK